MVLIDDFNRSENNTIGNGWIEIDNSPEGNAVSILNNVLSFKSAELSPFLISSYCYRSLNHYINPILSLNTEIIAWNFQMHGGHLETFFSAGGCINQTAYVLAANNNDFANSGSGYAVIYHRPQNDCGPEPEEGCYDNYLQLQLVGYSGGLNGFNKTTIINFPVYMNHDMLFATMRIEFDPSNSEWTMYALVDNTSFIEIPDQDDFPEDAFIRSGVENLYFTTQELNFTGTFHSYCRQGISGPSGNYAHFDNIYIKADPSLPVEFADFSLLRKSNGVLISFKTASENNNAWFIIEKSSDGKLFHPLTKIYSSGNFTAVKNYSFFDREVNTGLFYYRIRQVDFSGEFTYSPIRSITFTREAVYRPIVSTFFRESILIQNLKESAISFLILDIKGQKRMQGKFENILHEKFEIDTSILPAGIYILYIEEADSRHVFKVLKAQ